MFEFSNLMIMLSIIRISHQSHADRLWERNLSGCYSAYVKLQHNHKVRPGRGLGVDG